MTKIFARLLKDESGATALGNSLNAQFNGLSTKMKIKADGTGG